MWTLWDRASDIGPYILLDVLIRAYRQSDRQPNWDQGTVRGADSGGITMIYRDKVTTPPQQDGILFNKPCWKALLPNRVKIYHKSRHNTAVLSAKFHTAYWETELLSISNGITYLLR